MRQDTLKVVEVARKIGQLNGINILPELSASDAVPRLEKLLHGIGTRIEERQSLIDLKKSDLEKMQAGFKDADGEKRALLRDGIFRLEGELDVQKRMLSDLLEQLGLIRALLERAEKALPGEMLGELELEEEKA